MQTRTIAATLIAAGSCAAAVPIVATAQAPARSAVTINATATQTTFSRAVVLIGRVSGPKVAGVRVRLQRDKTGVRGDRFNGTGRTAVTNANGTYRFTVKPSVNTTYRVVAETSPQALSAAKAVLVRAFVGLTVRNPRPARGAEVRFSGTVRPVGDGRIVQIQRQTSKGGWVTVGRSLLRASTTGLGKSVYATKVRVFHNGLYRAMLPRNQDNLPGISLLRHLTVR